MNILIACEFSGIVRDCFRDKGHDAWSCDIIDSERPAYHIKDDVLNIIAKYKIDLMIAHPPCTYLCNSGAKHLYLGMNKYNGINEQRWDLMESAADFFVDLMNSNIPKICIENPIMHGHAKRIIKANQTQIIQPYEFGHGETKATCLWLKNLPMLKPTNIVEGRDARIHKMPPGENRWKERSRTYLGIAKAMAQQWG